MIEYTQTNWLISSAIVGFLRVLEKRGIIEFREEGINYKNTNEISLEGKTLKVSRKLLEQSVEYLADYLWEISGNNSGKIFGLLKNFFNNSPLAQIFQKEIKKTLKEIAGLNTERKDVQKYISTLGDKNKFKNLKEVLEFNLKFVNEEFITIILENLDKLQELEREISNKEKEKKKKEFIETLKEEPFIKQLNEWGKKLNENIIKRAIILELKNLLKEENTLFKETNLPTCRFCFKRKAHWNNVLEEKHFTPLFASSNTLENFFYNGKNTLFLCRYCEYLLYFSMFAFNKTPNGNYIFIYIPSDIETTFRINRLVEDIKTVSEDFLKETLARVVKKLVQQKVDWYLSNIFFVEIEPISQNTANVYTFHIPVKVAEVILELNLPEDFPRVLNPLLDIFLFYTFEGKSLYNLLHQIVGFYFYFRKPRNVKIENKTYRERIINFARKLKTLPAGLKFLILFEELLKEGLSMKEELQKQINWAFGEGKAIREKLQEEYSDRYEKKIETVSYKLLDAIRRRDIDAFAQNLIRLYIDVKKPIPKLFVDALNEEGFNRIAYAFLIGLNNEHKKDNQPNNEDDS